MPPKVVLEVLGVIFLAVLSTYFYIVFLGGIPYDILADAYRLSRCNFENLKYCWVSDGLGRPNDRLAFATTYALLAFLNFLGADLNVACSTLLSVLWAVGGASIYLLVKRFSKSSITSLAATLIYLGAATSLRSLWQSLDSSTLYISIPLVLLTVDEAYRKKPIYGFYTALVSTVFSGGLIKLDSLTVLTVTVLAYSTVKIYERNVKLKTLFVFFAVTGFSWLMMNIWWIVVPPGLNFENFNSICLIVFPISVLTFLLSARAGKMNIPQSLAMIAPAIILMDPRRLISMNVPPEVLAVISVDISILAALGLKRFSERFSDYISISLVLEGDKPREYDLVKPIIFLIALGVILYQRLTVPLLWTSSLDVPEYYGELTSILPPGDYRVLVMPIAGGEIYYNWSVRKYEKPIESIILDKPVIYGSEFTTINDLTKTVDFWKILSVLNVKYIVLHYDTIQSVDPKLIETRLNYSFTVNPSLADGVVNVTSEAVKPVMDDVGFIQLINFNPKTQYNVEIRYVDVEEAQSRIHIFAYGESWLSEQSNLNQTFSFAYLLPKTSNWFDYSYLEFWIKVNGSDRLTVQVQDVYGRWALWRLELKEQYWNLAILRLNDADLDMGLNRLYVTAVVFSVHAPLGTTVEVEVGGIFLDRGVILDVKPVEFLRKINQQLTVYRLKDGFETSNVYTVGEVLKSGGSIFEDILKDGFDPRSKAYVDGEPLRISYAELEYVKLKPTEYRVTVYNSKNRVLLVLNEKFSPEWTLYVGEPNPIDILLGIKQRGIEHLKINGFLNGWYIETEDSKPIELTVVYRPQILLEVFRMVSIVFVISGLIILNFKGRLVKILKTYKGSW